LEAFEAQTKMQSTLAQEHAKFSSSLLVNDILLNVPKFNGDGMRSYYKWKNAIELHVDDLGEENIRRLVRRSVQGSALDKFMQLSKDQNELPVPVTWKQIKEAFEQEFIHEHDRLQALSDLQNSQQLSNENPIQYKTRLVRLAKNAYGPDFSREYRQKDLIVIFIKGLQSHRLRTDLFKEKFKNIDEVCQSAMRHVAAESMADSADVPLLAAACASVKRENLADKLDTLNDKLEAFTVSAMNVLQQVPKSEGKIQPQNFSGQPQNFYGRNNPRYDNFNRSQSFKRNFRPRYYDFPPNYNFSSGHNFGHMPQWPQQQYYSNQYPAQPRFQTPQNFQPFWNSNTWNQMPHNAVPISAPIQNVGFMGSHPTDSSLPPPRMIANVTNNNSVPPASNSKN
jgi:hypothetical protein